MMGILLDKPFKTYPDCFPIILISEIQRTIGREIIGNCVASGTEIIKELGEMHMKTGALIVYTSADSVLQVAAHEDIIPTNELYEICEKISEIVFREEYNIGRVIARPFTGKVGEFTRTPNRHDYAKIPPTNFIDLLYNNGLDVIALGKIKDIFANKSITTGIKTTNNIDGLMKLIDFARGNFNGLCFLNLNDFDSMYGHRRDKDGYLKCLEEMDHYLPIFINKLKEDDLVIFTADHGNDPTFKGTDHTRENVPVIFYSKKFKYYGKLPTRNTFADIGATIIDNFEIENKLKIGKSYIDLLK
jgi:phosphopentomutase